MTIGCENGSVPRDHYRSHVLGPQYPRQVEKAATDTCLSFSDYTVGIPNTLKSDNAQSEMGSLWTTVSREHCITSETTEPKHP